MVTLVTSSVVRGSHQGESHGGVYLLDLESQSVRQTLDWNTADIDWAGRGADRGLRGIAFDGDVVYVAASDELFAYTPDFDLLGSWRNTYLKHCHEIAIYERTLYLTSTGYDSVLGFCLDERRFTWALHIDVQNFKFRRATYDPSGDDGPLLLNKLHINNVFCNRDGMYISGLKTGGMLHYNADTVLMSVELPPGTHNARPFRDGVLFNDTVAGRLRYTGRGEGTEDRAMAMPLYNPRDLLNTDFDDSGTARQGFARGLCVLSESVVAAGSSPSTISVYDLAGNQTLLSVNLTMDIRNAIHGLEVWPYA
ncbi:MAG: hypothetical protein GXP15_07950 [Gammaproteobacteria bacterium]|nr:hypothetical protein [Gammaproteobacteria bacterium]